VSRPARLLLLAALGLVLALGAFLPLPYYAAGPGPGREVTPLIRFDDRDRYDPGGHLVMTSVRIEQLTPFGLVAAWVDDTRAVFPRDEVFTPGVDRDLEDRRAFSEMDQSKIDASFVVLERLAGYPRAHAPGALVQSTASGCPADDQLFPGDVIVRIGDRTIGSVRQASRAIDAVPAGDPIEFVLDVDGTTESATFTRAPCGGDGEALVGVRLLASFPFPIAIESGDVGGPSAGLMWAIGLYELLTPGDLTAGRVIAGTGTIDLDGAVGAIGGIREKVVGAERVGASVFLVPDGNLAELEGIDTGEMRIIGVATFDDALEALREG